MAAIFLVLAQFKNAFTLRLVDQAVFDHPFLPMVLPSQKSFPSEAK